MNKIIAANWKMHKTAEEAERTINKMKELLGGKAPAGREIIIFAPFTALEASSKCADGFASIGAQNLYPASHGAFTGEISPSMIKACGANFVLTGHSERRHILHENEKEVGIKTAFALENGLNVMLCIGETLEERESGLLSNVLERQLILGTNFNHGLLDNARFMIAYEPVWAIGTGKSATSQDIAETHKICRSLIGKCLGEKADSIPLLYGGSVKPANAGSILLLDNVDGVLVGGSSLEAEQFCPIINA